MEEGEDKDMKAAEDRDKRLKKLLLLGKAGAEMESLLTRQKLEEE